MAVTIELPQVGESVVEGIIGKWWKKPGDVVEKYDPLVDTVLDSGGSNSAPILWDLWANIQSQTLVVRGEHSSVLTPEIARQMVAKGEHFELAEIPDAHHSVIDQNPGAFRDAVKSFLSF